MKSTWSDEPQQGMRQIQSSDVIFTNAEVVVGNSGGKTNAQDITEHKGTMETDNLKHVIANKRVIEKVTRQTLEARNSLYF